MLKSCGWGGVVGGGPCDYCVIPSPIGLDFGILDFGTSDLGLTINTSSRLKFKMYLKKYILCPFKELNEKFKATDLASHFCNLNVIIATCLHHSSWII